MKLNVMPPMITVTTVPPHLQPALAPQRRVLVAFCCMIIAAFTATSNLLAASIDGDYEIKRAIGTLTIEGRTKDIPKRLVRDLIDNRVGDITIDNQRLRIKHRALERIVQDFGDDISLDIDTETSGPRSITLNPTSRGYRGETPRPVVVEFESDDLFGIRLAGNLRANIVATVIGDKLTVRVVFSGRSLRQDISGDMTIVARR